MFQLKAVLGATFFFPNVNETCFEQFSCSNDLGQILNMLFLAV